MSKPNDSASREASHVMRLVLRAPYLVFLADVPTHNLAKTGLGVAQWCPEKYTALAIARERTGPAGSRTTGA